jgi:hypothetical protein
MPKSQWSTSPRWMTGASPSRSGRPPAPLHLDARLEPGAEAEVVDALAHPPDHVLGGRHAGRDHAVGEGLLDDLPRDAVHLAVDRVLGGQPRGEQLDREGVDADEARGVLGA